MFKRIARGVIRETVAAFASQTLFSKHPRIRALGFEVLGRHQPLIACTSARGEQFVVKAGDQYIGRSVFTDGEYDFGKFETAVRLITKYRNGLRPSSLIDVGANIGTICIPAVARGYVQRALAIEAEADNARLLRANIALNGLDDQITVVHAAAGPEDGKTLLLELATDNFGDHRIRLSDEPGPYGEAQRKVTTVPSSTLDTLTESVPINEAFVWMDVQGFEGPVLTGASSILASRAPLVLEFSPYHIDRVQGHSAILEATHHYSGFIDLNAEETLRPMSELASLRHSLKRGLATDILIL